MRQPCSALGGNLPKGALAEQVCQVAIVPTNEWVRLQTRLFTFKMPSTSNLDNYHHYRLSIFSISVKIIFLCYLIHACNENLLHLCCNDSIVIVFLWTSSFVWSLIFAVEQFIECVWAVLLTLPARSWKPCREICFVLNPGSSLVFSCFREGVEKSNNCSFNCCGGYVHCTLYNPPPNNTQ